MFHVQVNTTHFEFIKHLAEPFLFCFLTFRLINPADIEGQIFKPTPIVRSLVVGWDRQEIRQF